MEAQKLAELKTFIAAMRTNPALLHTPQLAFFKAYLEDMNATIPPTPPQAKASQPQPPPAQHNEDAPPLAEQDGREPPRKAPKQESAPQQQQQQQEEEEEAEVVESDVELPGANDLADESSFTAEDAPGPREGVSEEAESQAAELASLGRAALADDKLEEAIVKLSLALTLDGRATRTHVLRAKAYLKQKRVRAALQDCNWALALNPGTVAGVCLCTKHAHAGCCGPQTLPQHSSSAGVLTCYWATGKPRTKT